MARRGRPALVPGTHGTITVTRDGARWCARTNVRDYDGERRPVRRWAATKAAAERALQYALTTRAGSDASDELSADTKVRVLAERWLARIDEDVDLAVNSKTLYRRTVEKHVLPAIGGLRLRETNVQAVDRTLAAIRSGSGHGTAKTARSVLSGMLGFAARSGAIPANPVRDAQLGGAPSKTVRALTVVEAEDLSDGLRSSERAMLLDLPDLVDFMLGTGLRIGEACALRDEVLDLEVGTVEVNATLIRMKGAGVAIQMRPKSAAGWRVLAMPDHLVHMLRGRDEALRRLESREVTFMSEQGDIYTSTTAGMAFLSVTNAPRDPSNTAGDLRAVLDAVGCDDCGGSTFVDVGGRRVPCESAGPFGWVTSHVFRKTVATRLDEAGMSARQIADQLGHKRPSMTQDIYMGRKVVSAEAAQLLAKRKKDPT